MLKHNIINSVAKGQTSSLKQDYVIEHRYLSSGLKKSSRKDTFVFKTELYKALCKLS